MNTLSCPRAANKQSHHRFSKWLILLASLAVVWMLLQPQNAMQVSDRASASVVRHAIGSRHADITAAKPSKPRETIFSLPEAFLLRPSSFDLPVTDAAAQDANPSSRFSLKGIVMYGNGRIAILWDNWTSDEHAVTEGELLEGMLIERIDQNQVVVSIDGEREQLQFASAASQCIDSGTGCSDTREDAIDRFEMLSDEIQAQATLLRNAREQRRQNRATAPSP